MTYPEYRSTDTSADMHSNSNAYNTGIKLGSKKKLNIMNLAQTIQYITNVQNKTLC